MQHCIVYHQSNCTVSVDISFWMQFAALISSFDTMRVMAISHCISRFTAAYHGLPLHITVWRNTHCLIISFTFKSPHWQYHSIFLTHGLPQFSLFKYILLYSNKSKLATPPLLSSITLSIYWKLPLFGFGAYYSIQQTLNLLYKIHWESVRIATRYIYIVSANFKLITVYTSSK